MKVKREWQDNQELFEAVADALDNVDVGQVQALDEEGRYGDCGTITITVDGRKFSLELHEIV